MSTDKPYVVEVTTQTFETVVLLAPPEQVIVVDFWAPWCAPCKTLGPVLESAIEPYQGQALLAKVNVDEQPELAAPFAIRSIPAVKIFQGGKIVQEFTGALPQHEIERILASLIPTEGDDRLQQAETLLDSGRDAEALTILEAILESEPENSGALLARARLALRNGDLGACEKAASAVAEDAPEYEAAQAVLNGLSFTERAQTSGGLESCIARVEEDGKNWEARIDLGFCYAAAGRYEEALETLLAVATGNGKSKDEVREAMVKVFGVIGQRSELSDRYRKKLQLILY